jgi:uncharacterized protein (DUF924 family)
MPIEPLAVEILDFWFAGSGEPRDVWFRKDPAFDAIIRERFADAVEAAIDGAYESWTAEPRGALACVLLLDQFTRNIYRGTPRAFAGDRRALAIAQRVVAAGEDVTLAPYERAFLYLPYEHSEDTAVHDQSIAVFSRLRDETGLDGPLEWAEKHAVIVRRFGRYPHRNAILGRTSTPEETAFLEGPNSGF